MAYIYGQECEKLIERIEELDTEEIIELYSEYANKVAELMNNNQIDEVCDLYNEYDFLGHLIAESVARGSGYKLTAMDGGISLQTD